MALAYLTRSRTQRSATSLVSSAARTAARRVFADKTFAPSPSPWQSIHSSSFGSRAPVTTTAFHIVCCGSGGGGGGGRFGATQALSTSANLIWAKGDECAQSGTARVSSFRVFFLSTPALPHLAAGCRLLLLLLFLPQSSDRTHTHTRPQKPCVRRTLVRWSRADCSDRLAGFVPPAAKVRVTRSIAGNPLMRGFFLFACGGTRSQIKV